MGILYYLMLIPHTQRHKSVWFSTTALYLKGICHLYSLTITSYLVFPLDVSIQFLHVVPDLFGLFHVDLEGETRRVRVDRFEKENSPCTANLGRFLQTPPPPTSTLCHHHQLHHLNIVFPNAAPWKQYLFGPIIRTEEYNTSQLLHINTDLVFILASLDSLQSA